jgi:hypothetical protein
LAYEYIPDPQLVQTALPTLPAYMPAAHHTQPAAPGELCERPIGQLAQVVEDPAPVDIENVPVLQAKHVLEALAPGTLE